MYEGFRVDFQLQIIIAFSSDLTSHVILNFKIYIYIILSCWNEYKPHLQIQDI